MGDTCGRVYLVVSKIIVQCVFQFTKELLFFLFLSFFSLLEETVQSISTNQLLFIHWSENRDLVGDLPSDRFLLFVNVVYFPDARSKIYLGILAIVECFLTF